MSQNKGKGGFDKVVAVTGTPGAPTSVRTGDPAIDQTLDILRDDGFELQDMMMPFPLVIMIFNNKATHASAMVIFKEGDQPVKTPTGMLITESLIDISPDDNESTEPAFMPVTQFLAGRARPQP
ncbi:MAG: hypothetical protein KKA05_07510 [Alphaproteobacteria bacterium]|nr:hypothetical protein [Alphaproteobacteria bacterium]MBU0859688.1 hypothetical protein [Alphaproteobacteria bacterium]